MTYCTQENLGREKLVNRELFAMSIFTDAPKMYLAYALTVAYSPNFSSPIPFTGNIWRGKILANLVNSWRFAKLLPSKCLSFII